MEQGILLAAFIISIAIAVTTSRILMRKNKN